MFGLSPSGGELLLLMMIALLLFGRNLPDVAMNIGKGLREFQSGLKGMQDEIKRATNSPSGKSSNSNYYADSSSSRPIPDEEQEDDDYDVPKFELPTGPPEEES